MTVSTMMTLAQAHALLQSRLPAGEACRLVGDGGVPLRRVHSDTRSLQPGDLFVALKGERFDAHDFLPQAAASGAVAALAQRGLREAGLPGLQVADTLRALGALAAAWRAQFDLPVIAVTGSNGKTTVTQMTAAILRAWVGGDAFSTEGNFNNDIGVPLTLLRLAKPHRAAVVELGMNHPGEIAGLASMAAPTVALVNNAQREHQEFMATVEAVARENGAAIEALGPQGVAVFPADDEFAPLWRELSGARRQLTFALQGDADVTAQAQWVSAQAERDRDASPHWSVRMQTPAGPAGFRLHVAGLHNVKNALAACACALAAGCPLDAVVRGLEAFAPVKGRSQLKRFVRAGRSVTLVDDSYNANPDSVRAAIDVLAALPGPRWLVLGDMAEVGDHGPAFHREVGAYACARGIDALWTAGAASIEAARAFSASRHFDAVGDLLAALPEAPGAVSVVVKGSRFMKMEQVVEALMRSAQDSENNNNDQEAGGDTDAA
jgi:UDP-N-acetylmuramoyl-tripeptide--D-alanyl-D-alanine ligase